MKHWQLDWTLLDHDFHRKLQAYVKALNKLYVEQPALHQVDFSWEGFQWIDFHDVDNSIVSFVRRARDPDDFMVVLANFTPVPREGYRVGVPAPGFYRELLNSDSTCYGGSNVGNSGGLPSEPTPWQGQPHSILLTVPPLAVVFFKPDREERIDNGRAVVMACMLRGRLWPKFSALEVVRKSAKRFSDKTHNKTKS